MSSNFKFIDISIDQKDSIIKEWIAKSNNQEQAFISTASDLLIDIMRGECGENKNPELRECFISDEQIGSTIHTDLISLKVIIDALIIKHNIRKKSTSVDNKIKTIYDVQYCIYRAIQGNNLINYSNSANSDSYKECMTPLISNFDSIVDFIKTKYNTTSNYDNATICGMLNVIKIYYMS